MKTRKNLIAVLVLLFMGVNVIAQKPTVAVPNVKTYGLNISPEIGAKLVRLELIKIEKYNVLDEFDMNEVMKGTNEELYKDCYGKSCLVQMGKELKVDYIFSGSLDGLGNKIVVNIKMIDVKADEIKQTLSMEFDNQENEIQRMIAIVIQEMHGIQPNKETKDRLAFKNEVITSNNVGKINNSGPRMGVSYTVGGLNEYLSRPESQGGADIFPGLTNIGYQFEGQYVGTENFSALVEGVFMISGMEQGQVIPSFALLNGFRFGSKGWEFAFGPSFTLRKSSKGIFGQGGDFLNEGQYYTDSEFNSESRNYYKNNPEYYDSENNSYIQAIPTLQEHNTLYGKQYYSKSTLDKRGPTYLTTNFVVAFGRTFNSGALNIPVNIFYSGGKYGGMLGTSVGFNIQRKKEPINNNTFK